MIKLMSQAGLIPRELENVNSPTCPGCAYGKAHRKPWQRKGVRNRKILNIDTVPGQVVSVEQLVSPTPGFVPTHRGTPTTKRYIVATVFVDHFSNLTYAHLMTEMITGTMVEISWHFSEYAMPMASDLCITIQTMACLIPRHSRNLLLRPNRLCNFEELMITIRMVRQNKALKMLLKERALLFCMKLTDGQSP